MTTGAARLAREVLRGFAPPPDLTVSEWADQERRLPPESSAEPGQWRTDRAEYQRAIMDATAAGGTVVLLASSQIGKALAVDTPLPTPDGWTTIGDIKPGATLFDERGQPCRVTFVSDVQLDRPCFRIRFGDGAMLIADAEHRWPLTRHQSFDVVAPTRDLPSWAANHYRVPVAAALELPEAELPVAPYVLGVWLGDGHSYSTQITLHRADGELLQHLEAEGVRPCIVSQTARGILTVALDQAQRGHNALSRQLRALGLLRGRNRTDAQNAKHIPARYLRASIQQRTALLQGLLDTDGSMTAKGSAEFSTTSERLAEGVGELLPSLGYKFRLWRTTPRVWYQGGFVQGAPAWRFTFRPYADVPVFRLRRKRWRQAVRQEADQRSAKTAGRLIRSVEPVPSVPVRCLQVDAPSHLFLAGREMIPTHNTEVLLNILGYHIDQDPAPVLLVEPTLELASAISKDRIGPMFRDTPALARKAATFRVKDAATTTLHRTFPGGHLTLAGANSPASLASRPIRILLADEVDRWKAQVGEEGDPLDLAIKRTTTFWNRSVFVVSTPTIKGASRIEAWYEQSDQRRFFVPCPRCGARHELEWRNVRWTEHDPATAHLVCPVCAGRIEDRERAAMVRAGEWRPTAPYRGITGFFVWECYALALDTPLPTPGGWTTMETVKAGDRLFDETGRPCSVVDATGIMIGRPCYRVTFAGGESITADGEHLWAVTSPRGKRLILPTKHLAGAARFRCGATRYAVPVAKALDLPEAPLPIDPYVLGAWLGDGDSYHARIFCWTRDSEEMASHLSSSGDWHVTVRAAGPTVSHLLLRPSRPNRLGLRQSLRILGINSRVNRVTRRHWRVVDSWRKRIPEVYLRASVGQRLALLQGLMDTDGTAGTRRECSFSTTVLALGDGMMELARTLGLKPRRYERERPPHRREIRVCFTAPPDLPVFRLQRKRARQSQRHATGDLRLNGRRIMSVEPVDSVPVKCVAVDSPSRLYLAGASMIPTHNSPWRSLRQLVTDFHGARQRGPEAMRAWVNTALGQSWEDEGESVEPHVLLVRREVYGPTLPEGICCLTLGVDVQDDRLECLVLGWGPGEECWIVEVRTIPGDPVRPEPWAGLDAMLGMPWPHASGAQLMILATAIDSAGHRTKEVYEYVRRRTHLRVYATIGRDGDRPAISAPAQRRWGREQRPIQLFTLGVDGLKSLIYSRLRIPTPGPGYVHLPADRVGVDEEWANQVTSERLVTRWERGVASRRWVQTRARNEGLDTLILNLGALRLLNPRLEVMAERVRRALEPKAPPPPVEVDPADMPARQIPAAPPARPPGRRVFHSPWMRRGRP